MEIDNLSTTCLCTLYIHLSAVQYLSTFWPFWSCLLRRRKQINESKTAFIVIAMWLSLLVHAIIMFPFIWKRCKLWTIEEIHVNCKAHNGVYIYAYVFLCYLFVYKLYTNAHLVILLWTVCFSYWKDILQQLYQKGERNILPHCSWIFISLQRCLTLSAPALCTNRQPFLFLKPPAGSLA